MLAAARGQSVYWHAWGGEQSINDYIAWAGAEVEKRFGVEVEHVKLTDTAEAVSKVVAEKAAGRTVGRLGRPDLDQRGQFRGDEGTGSAVRSVGGGSAQLQACGHGRKGGADQSTSRCPPRAMNRRGTWRRSYSSTTLRRVRDAAQERARHSRLCPGLSGPHRLSRCPELSRRDISEAVADRPRRTSPTDCRSPPTTATSTK